MLLDATMRYVFAFAASLILVHSAMAQPEEGEAGSDAAANDVRQELSREREQELRQRIVSAPAGEERWRAYNDLVRAYRSAGRMGESLKLNDDMLNDERLSVGRRSIIASDLALAQALMGDHARSQRLISRAKQLANEAKPDDIERLLREPTYTYLHAEAEIARRSRAQHDIALAKTRERSELAWANFNNPALSERRRQAAANELLNNVQLHVILLVQNNRRQEALSYWQEIDRRLSTRADLQATPVQLGSIQAAYAIALCSFDEYDAALTAINASIATYQRAKVGEQQSGYGQALRLRLFITLALGRITDYLPDAEAMMRGRAANPVLNGSFPAGEAESLLLAARGQWHSASARLVELLDRNTRVQGTESPFYRYQSSLQMLYMLHDPAWNASVSSIERFMNRQTNTDDWPEARYRGSYVEDGALATAMDRLMRWTGDGAPEQRDALAFRIAELLRVNASQGALADGAARLVAADPSLRALIEQEQLLRFDQATSRRAFALSLTQAERARVSGDEAVTQRQAEDAAKKEKALQAAAGRLKDLRRQIAAQFPIYREMISPDIPDSKKLGAALRPGEVYVNLYAGEKASHVFVVHHSGRLHAQRLEATRGQLKVLAGALRAGFDAGTPPTQRNPLGGFDLAAAHSLYQAVVEPIESQLQGASTVYLSSGSFSYVPWNVLLTRPAATLADASWWSSAVTTVQMPSGSALVLARSRADSKASTPFAAFADPSFDGQPRASSEAATRSAVRSRAVRTGVDAATAQLYRSLAPLPETLDEVRAIGATLNAAAQSIVHGPAAARSTVLKQDLSSARVVAFATHGLMPGELPGLLKAGLAMSYEGQGLADSMLTIDDIVALRLNADWVVLSACNTGLSSGFAGDTISALSRGFFAAGARSLLVTQWAVESESATPFTIGLFKAYIADPSLSKAAALARVQRDMLAGKLGENYRHPYFWAAYSLAGDAAR